MKLAVYLSGIPKKSRNQSKRQILTTFADGARAVGDQVVLVEDNRIVNCDVAVIQGYVHEGSRQAPHLMIRRNAIDHQKQHGKHSVIIDSNLYQFLNPDDQDRYLRYGLDGIFANDAWYFDKKRDLTRWDKIKLSYGFQERNWSSGNSILVCLQRNGGWSMSGRGAMDWAIQTVSEIRAYTDRPIIVRGHPGDQHTLTEFDVRPWANVHKQHPKEMPLRKQLAKTHATVTYNSSPGVASILYGTPVFVTDPIPERSQCWPICNTNLKNIETPELFDRQDFYHKLAQCHWKLDEVGIGDAWRFMRDRLPNS